MKRRILSVILAGMMLLLPACSGDVSDLMEVDLPQEDDHAYYEEAETETESEEPEEEEEKEEDQAEALEEDTEDDTEADAEELSDEELCALAGEYYFKVNGKEAPIVEIDSADGDIVMIHLYAESGDHTETMDWYEVDRTTGDATDVMGEVFNLFDEVSAESDTVTKSTSKRPEGKKISFVTTDIDGNKITSDEIFSKHKVTMVNVWATWCYWCLYELPELKEINERLEEKDCAIVGLLGDGTDDDVIEEAKDILEENGIEYLNILPWDGATETDFNMDEGWPTSFFVDQNGVMVAEPVVGAETDAYEEVIDDILDSM